MALAQNLSLGEFTKQLAALLAEANVEMPFKNERPWHILFFRLKQQASPAKPAFFEQLRFDWDGPYPRCQDLSDFVQALHWSSNISVGNPSYEILTLPKEIKALWKTQADALDGPGHQFLKDAQRLAGEIFQAAA